MADDCAGFEAQQWRDTLCRHCGAPLEQHAVSLPEPPAAAAEPPAAVPPPPMAPPPPPPAALQDQVPTEQPHLTTLHVPPPPLHVHAGAMPPPPPMAHHAALPPPLPQAFNFGLGAQLNAGLHALQPVPDLPPPPPLAEQQEAEAGHAPSLLSAIAASSRRRNAGDAAEDAEAARANADEITALLQLVRGRTLRAGPSALGAPLLASVAARATAVDKAMGSAGWRNVEPAALEHGGGDVLRQKALLSECVRYIRRCLLLCLKSTLALHPQMNPSAAANLASLERAAARMQRELGATKSVADDLGKSVERVRRAALACHVSVPTDDVHAETFEALGCVAEVLGAARGLCAAAVETLLQRAIGIAKSAAEAPARTRALKISGAHRAIVLALQAAKTAQKPPLEVPHYPYCDHLT